MWFFGFILWLVLAIGSLVFIRLKFPDKLANPKYSGKTGYLEDEYDHDVLRIKSMVDGMIKKFLLPNALICTLIPTIFVVGFGGVFSVGFVCFYVFTLIVQILFLKIVFGLLGLRDITKKYGGIRTEDSANIVRSERVDGFGMLRQVLRPELRCDQPLITFTEALNQQDPWNEKRSAFYSKNSDRGLIQGVPGTGKSTLLIAQLIQWMKSGQPFVCTDIKPEIWGILNKNKVFEKYGYTPVVFNPTNPQAAHYNPFSEIDDVIELSELLEVVVPTGLSSDDETFSSVGRKILKAISLELGQEASLPALRKYIYKFDSPDEMIDSLIKSKNETVSILAKEIRATSKNERLLGNALTSMQKAFSMLDDDKIVQTLSDSTFKLKELFLQPKTCLILQFPEESSKLTKSVFGMMLTQTIRAVQSSSKKRAHAVFMAFDEITNSAPIPDFKKKLLLLRSSNAPTFLYFQELNQFDELYGVGSIDTFMSSSNLKIVFKANDNATADYYVKQLGKTEATFINTGSGTSFGGSEGTRSYTTTKNQNESTQRNTQQVNIIESNELMRMKQGHALIIYEGRAGILPMPQYYKDFPQASAKIDDMAGDERTPS